MHRIVQKHVRLAVDTAWDVLWDLALLINSKDVSTPTFLYRCLWNNSNSYPHFDTTCDVQNTSPTCRPTICNVSSASRGFPRPHQSLCPRTPLRILDSLQNWTLDKKTASSWKKAMIVTIQRVAIRCSHSHRRISEINGNIANEIDNNCIGDDTKGAARLSQRDTRRQTIAWPWKQS